MTYYFEYSFDHESGAEMQEWQIYLTPEEESDYLDEGIAPSDAAMSIAADSSFTKTTKRNVSIITNGQGNME